MDTLAMAATFFRRRSGIAAAYAFGSVPEGRSHRESDLDLAVLLDWSRYPDRASRAERQLELLSDLLRTLATNRVDLVVLNDAPPLLARRISRGTLLYARSEDDVQAFERDVQLRAADVEAFVQRGRARLLEALGA
jgi:uncharacterized protein